MIRLALKGLVLVGLFYLVLKAHPGFGASQDVVKITSEPEDGLVRWFRIHHEKGVIAKLEVVKEGRVDKSFGVKELNDSVLVATVKGFDAMFLSCPACSNEQGGALTMRYLINGATQSFGSKSLVLKRLGSNWSVYLPGQEAPVAELSVKANRFLGLTVGVDEVEAILASPQ